MRTKKTKGINQKQYHYHQQQQQYLVAPLTQWAAVMTHSSDMREAVQNPIFEKSATTQGNWLGLAS